MIAFVRGTVSDMGETSLVVDTGAVGYEIFMTAGDLNRITVGMEVRIHTYFLVREDALQLYGFLSRDDLGMFRLLLGVSGIGPKGALGLLSGITADELRFAVLSDDVKAISRAPGIGKKTAQKVILELKDKLNLQDAFEASFSGSEDVLPQDTGADLPDGRRDAVEALIALGYSSTEALRAVRQVKDVSPDDVEGILKAALKNL